ncbi:unnamed protein product [Ranitomeya imitator]|uniref:Reverse transcriptase domain-containing protein n=1 Tax=Ranitomeya imitator TaxID=111125 RepID=A0ABN9LLY3_9NEOB|nr:unnamed protein product [Ranitomeya imitator]
MHKRFSRLWAEEGMDSANIFALEATGGDKSLDVRFEGQGRIESYPEAADFRIESGFAKPDSVKSRVKSADYCEKSGIGRNTKPNASQWGIKVGREFPDQTMDPTDFCKGKLDQLIGRAAGRGILNKKEVDFLITDFPVVPTFYLLPNVHKSLENPPGRPIVSGINGLFEKPCTYLDFFLQPLAMKLTSFLKDSTHLIQLLQNLNLPSGTILIILDVESLYTNIKHDVGLEAVSFFLDSNTTGDREHEQFLLDLLVFVLDKNYFVFDRNFYRQVKGTAMGAWCAPSYANLFLEWWEELVVYKHEAFRGKCLKCLRYIDDILMFWTGTEEDCDQFIADLNENSLNIRLTSHVSHTSVEFLDLEASLVDSNVVTTLYRKPTATNSLLHYSSFHPRHLKDGIPTGQFLRLKRNCSLSLDFQNEARSLTDRFKHHGYPKKVISTAFQRARTSPRTDLLQRKTHYSKKNFLQLQDTLSCVRPHLRLSESLPCYIGFSCLLEALRRRGSTSVPLVGPTGDFPWSPPGQSNPERIPQEYQSIVHFAIDGFNSTDYTVVEQGEDIVPVYQIKGISKLVKLCLPKVQCFCDSLTSPPSERQIKNNLDMLGVYELVMTWRITITDLQQIKICIMSILAAYFSHINEWEKVRNKSIVQKYIQYGTNVSTGDKAVSIIDLVFRVKLKIQDPFKATRDIEQARKSFQELLLTEGGMLLKHMIIELVLLTKQLSRICVYCSKKNKLYWNEGQNVEENAANYVAKRSLFQR